MESDLYSNITGVILAGGKSSRMGTPKGSLCVGGRPIINRVADVFLSLFADNLIVARDPHLYHSVGFPIYTDIYPQRASMVGLHAAIHNCATDYAFCAACDMPFLSGRVIRRLASRIASGIDVVLPVLETRPQPLHAIYGKSCLEPLTERCRHHRFTLQDLFEELNVVQVHSNELLIDDPWMLSFINCNTLDDLEFVRNIAAEFDL